MKRRRLRKLVPDGELIRRRAAGEPLRELASDYDVAHTTLGRFQPCWRRDLYGSWPLGGQSGEALGMVSAVVSPRDRGGVVALCFRRW